MLAELIRFACVGLLAMAVHFLTVALLVPLGMAPLAANAVGFLVAFQARYAGHSGWTFRNRAQSGSYLRLFLVSAAGFAVNEGCYAALLELDILDYRTALAVVLAGVAAGTYLLSKLWVFNRTEKTP